tara:strand:- start:20322 stop:23042 length:2721 start_codon:yes stop_codon:yes gene_type:complete
MKRFLLAIFILFAALPNEVFATHNRAGEITYEYVSGFTYRITITTYTDASSVTADRCELDKVSFGDGVTATVPRINGTGCGATNQGCQHCGVDLGRNIKKNVYVTEHTYPGTGTYRITMEDPNRNAGIINIPNSVQVVFYLYSELNIISAGVPNSSPVLTNPPVDNACLNLPYKHNPGAVDKDISKFGTSDSLSYRLVSCYGNGGVQIPNYTLPDQWPISSQNTISIDSVTGTLLWDSPKLSGEYNVAILIEEWRKIGNQSVKIGSILRDLQITVAACPANTPPRILPVSDTCVTATQVLRKMVTAVDDDFMPNGQDYQTVELSATGDPFFVQGNKAQFPTDSKEQKVTIPFTWSTQCNHIRQYPYFVVFRAEDNYPILHLADYRDWRINVVAPAPTDIRTEPVGAGISVSWNYSTCTNAVGYKIYRKIDSIGYQAPACLTGIPASTGYKLVGTTTDGSSTLFFDDDQGTGLVAGQTYCYMVYAYFLDGAESYPSVESCAILRKEVPIITRVSVNSTDISTGSDTIKWSKPVDIDVQNFPGPYQYKILRKEPGGVFAEVASSIVSSDFSLIDTLYVDSALNTKEVQYTYRIAVYSKDSLIGPSRPATSPQLKAKPLDNRLELSLNINVPWTNSTMYVYRKNAAGNFVYLDSANSLVYTDSNLINGKEYCYYITTKGSYSDASLESRLLNNSQIVCATPIDKQAPCPPQQLKVDSKCELFYNDLSWLNPNEICDTTDDVVSYNVYFRPTSEGDLVKIASVLGAKNTTLLFPDLESVAGCYAITAVDSFNNESEFSNVVCVDNCPYYELPNIFTPGDDGLNDYYIPLPSWRYVTDVDMHIYNRWGEEVYTTTEPALGWAGNGKNGELITDGVYFYVCTVHEIRLEGIVERVLKGTITLLREESGKPSN